jgi:hypothetical protein
VGRGLVGVATQERASTGQHSWPSTRKQSRKPPDRPLISQERAQRGLIASDADDVHDAERAVSRRVVRLDGDGVMAGNLRLSKNRGAGGYKDNACGISYGISNNPITLEVGRGGIVNMGRRRAISLKPFVAAAGIRCQPNLGTQIAVLAEMLVSLPGAPLQ